MPETKFLPSIQRLISNPTKEIPILEKEFKIYLATTLLLVAGGVLSIAIAALMPYDIILRAAALIVAGIILEKLKSPGPKIFPQRVM
ncbi:MAG: hypothetical protein ACFFDI_04540, partial [Promethearchaeota archaeon]